MRHRRPITHAHSLNIGTHEKYPELAEQTRNHSELPSLIPEFEISYSPSLHIFEDLTINPPPFPSPLSLLHELPPIPPIDSYY